MVLGVWWRWSSAAREYKHVFVLLADGSFICRDTRDRRAENDL
jgi:hypothetical protein